MLPANWLLAERYTLNTRLALITGLVAAVSCAPAFSQDYEPFPGVSVDQRTLAMQERVDELYEAGNHERAFFIYRNELAPRGDKYAQYMVGYMYLNGQSVPQDRPTALAWYRLSAERGSEQLAKARDELAQTMTREEIEQSNTIFVDLLQDIGDTTLIMKLIRRDMDTLKGRTGTRLAGATVPAPLRIYEPSGIPVSPNYYRDVRRRLEARLNWLETKVEVDDIALESGNDEIRMFEEQVRAELAALEIP